MFQGGVLRKGIPVPKDDTHKSCVPHLDPLRDQKSSRNIRFINALGSQKRSTSVHVLEDCRVFTWNMLILHDCGLK